MDLKPEDISSVNGYTVIKIDGIFTVHEVNERDGLRQIGRSFETFQAAAKYALSLPNFLQSPNIKKGEPPTTMTRGSDRAALNVYCGLRRSGILRQISLSARRSGSQNASVPTSWSSVTVTAR
jgi:hypothetical protein